MDGGTLMIFKSYIVKFIAAAGIFLGITISQQHYQVATLLFIMITIDTILGTMVALKLKRFSSWGMSRLIYKIVPYGLAIITVTILSSILNFGEDVAIYLMSYIIVLEGVSNLEKLSILGVQIPNRLIKLINSQFEDTEKAKESWIRRSELRK